MGNRETVDLFCGAGGLSEGFSMAGFQVLLGADNDSAALETFHRNQKGAEVIEADIASISPRRILRKIGGEPPDVILGGPPCQGVSLSGPRKFHDPRNKLFLAFIRMTETIGPRAFVLESVPGLVGLFQGRIKDAIIDEFKRIGYDVTTRVLVAADYGVPQLRKRVFLVGLRNGERKFAFPCPTHSNENTLFGQKEYVTCDDALSDLPSPIGAPGSEKQEYTVPPKNEYQKAMRTDSEHVYNHTATNHTEMVTRIIEMVPEGGNYRDLPDRYKHTRNFHVAWTRYHSKKPAPTIDTGHRHHFHYKYPRVPTVRENARLQSFPDRYIFCGNKTEQYRLVGNAVPPLLGKAIAQELMKCL